MPVAEDVVERYVNEFDGTQFSVGYNDDAFITPKEDETDRFDYVLPCVRIKHGLENALSRQELGILKEIIEKNPKEYMEMRNFKNGRIKTAAITYHGDKTKMVCMKATPYSYDIQDVYELNTIAYDGRIADLVKAFEKGMRYYETERFERSYRRFVSLYGFELFRKYDPETGEYIGIDPERAIGRKDTSSERENLERRSDRGRSLGGAGKSGGLTGRIQRSLPSNGLLNQGIADWQTAQQHTTNQQQTAQRPLGERQFTAKTLQESQAVP